VGTRVISNVLTGTRRGSVRTLLPLMMLLCGLFLAHGLQCAAAHASGPHSPSSTATSVPHSAEADGSDPAWFLGTGAHSIVGDHAPAGDDGALPLHASLACIAVLVALFIFTFTAGRQTTISRWRLAEGASRVLSAARSRRPPGPALVVLCVSRT